MIVRRLLILVAVLMAVTAVAVALDPRGERGGGSGDAAQVEPSPTPATGAARDDAAPAERDRPPQSEAPLRTLDTAESGQVVRVRPGDRIRLRVVSDELETVQLGTDGPIEVVDDQSPAEFEFLVEEGLTADIRLLESGRTIGRVTTRGG